MKIIYHIFTNNRDEWLDDYNEAHSLFKEWVKEYSCARLFEEKWENPEVDAEEIEETCLESFGPFPS